MAKYAEILFRHWIQFFLLLFILPGILGAGSVLLFRTQQASAALWIDTPTYLGNAAQPADWNRYLTPAQNQQDSLFQLLETRSFRGDLGQYLVDSGAVGSTAERDAAIGSLSKQLQVLATGSHLLTISVTCDRAPVCLGVIEGLIKVYHDRLTQTQKDQSDLASSFLAGQLADAQSALKISEDALRSYLTNHPGTTLVQAAAIPELDLLVRQADLDRQSVNSLQQQLSGVTYSSAAAARVVETISKVVDEPKISHRGIISGSGAVKKGLLAVVGCWAAATVYLLLLAWLDRAAREPQELERRLRVPVLVTVPHFAQMGKF